MINLKEKQNKADNFHPSTWVTHVFNLNIRDLETRVWLDEERKIRLEETEVQHIQSEA